MQDQVSSIRIRKKHKDNDKVSKGTILVADDEEIICSVTAQMLNRLGFKAITAPDGRDAVALLRKNKNEIVCVLLDLTMPYMDGEETFHELQKVKPEISVILCSGYGEQEINKRFAKMGLAGFINKPFNLVTLKEKLDEVLQKSK